MDFNDYNRLEQVISDSRLSTYRQQFHTNNPRIITSSYIWNTKLSENFYFLLQNLEVGLRNSIYNAFTLHFPSTDFFHIHETDISKSYVERREYHSYACWRMIGKLKNNFTKQGLVPSDGKIIAELNFGFWTKLLNERHYRSKMWQTILPTAFPNYPFSHSLNNDRKTIALKIDTVRNFRNRIFHYEPIFNHAHLHRIHHDIIEVLGWLSPELQKLSLAFDEFNDILYSKKKINKKLQRLYPFNKKNRNRLKRKRRP